MWGHANPDGTHPVERGRYFREEILCEGVPDPPPNIIIDPQVRRQDADRPRAAGDPPEGADLRRLPQADRRPGPVDGELRRHRPLPHRTRSSRAAPPSRIDATGTVPLPSDGTVLEFKNFVELVDKLADKKDVYTCFASQYLDYTSGRAPGELNDCETQAGHRRVRRSPATTSTQLVLASSGRPASSPAGTERGRQPCATSSSIDGRCCGAWATARCSAPASARTCTPRHDRADHAAGDVRLRQRVAPRFEPHDGHGRDVHADAAHGAARADEEPAHHRQADDAGARQRQLAQEHVVLDLRPGRAPPASTRSSPTT